MPGARCLRGQILLVASTVVEKAARTYHYGDYDGGSGESGRRPSMPDLSGLCVIWRCNMSSKVWHRFQTSLEELDTPALRIVILAGPLASHVRLP